MLLILGGATKPAVALVESSQALWDAYVANPDHHPKHCQLLARGQRGDPRCVRGRTSTSPVWTLVMLTMGREDATAVIEAAIDCTARGRGSQWKHVGGIRPQRFWVKDRRIRMTTFGRSARTPSSF